MLTGTYRDLQGLVHYKDGWVGADGGGPVGKTEGSWRCDWWIGLWLGLGRMPKGRSASDADLT